MNTILVVLEPFLQQIILVVLFRHHCLNIRQGIFLTFQMDGMHLTVMFVIQLIIVYMLLRLHAPHIKPGE